jgi:hypothetical protein
MIIIKLIIAVLYGAIQGFGVYYFITYITSVFKKHFNK